MHIKFYIIQCFKHLVCYFITFIYYLLNDKKKNAQKIWSKDLVDKKAFRLSSRITQIYMHTGVIQLKELYLEKKNQYPQN